MFENINIIQKMMLFISVLIIFCLTHGIIFAIRENRNFEKNLLKKEKLQKYLSSIILQITVISGLLSLFNISAMLSDSVQAKPGREVWVIWLSFFVLIAACTYVFCFERKGIVSVKSLKEWLLENREIIVLICVSAIIRIFLWNDIITQRWDAGEYYYRLGTACENYDFTWESIWAHFRLCGHSSIGFAMLFAIGEFLNPRGVKGVLFINLIMTIVALYMIYEMLQKYWRAFNRKQAIIGVALVSVAPMFLGTFGYINVDYVLAIVFIYMLYAEYKRNYILLAFWGIVLTQTKETGVVVVAGYYLAHLLEWLIKYKGNTMTVINNILKERITWSTMIIAVFYARYIYKLRALAAWGPVAGTMFGMQDKSEGVNCFSLNPIYILTRLKQFFMLNFTWMLVVVLFVALFILVKKKIKSPTSNMNGIIGGMVGFIVFSCSYITHEIARYNILPTVVIIIVIYCFAENIFNLSILKRHSYKIWVLVSLLFLIQNFVPIDFVSNHAFQIINTGNGKMLYSKNSVDYMGDYLVNNYQYTWIDRAYDDMLKNVHYEEDMMIILPEEQSGTHINGNYGYYDVNWDKELQRRVMYCNEQTVDINVQVLDEVRVLSIDELPDSAMMFFIPYYELNQDEMLKAVSDKYDVVYEGDVTNWGGTIQYYMLEKKK